MKTLAYTYWQDGDAWLGYLDEFPDYLTQGESLADLKDPFDRPLSRSYLG